MNVGMVFLLIFSIIVIMLFFIFGFDMITNLMCAGSEAKTTKNINDLEFMVDDLYLQAEGSSNVFELNLPRGDRFCFVDPENPGDNLAGEWKVDPIIQDYIRDEGFTLWYDHCTGTSGYMIAKLKPTQNFCVDSSTDLYLENKGFFVSIEIL